MYANLVEKELSRLFVYKLADCFVIEIVGSVLAVIQKRWAKTKETKEKWKKNDQKGETRTTLWA